VYFLSSRHQPKDWCLLNELSNTSSYDLSSPRPTCLAAAGEVAQCTVLLRKNNIDMELAQELLPSPLEVLLFLGI
jgi:hypothetical protein